MSMKGRARCFCSLSKACRQAFIFALTLVDTPMPRHTSRNAPKARIQIPMPRLLFESAMSVYIPQLSDLKNDNTPPTNRASDCVEISLRYLGHGVGPCKLVNRGAGVGSKGCPSGLPFFSFSASTYKEANANGQIVFAVETDSICLLH